MVSSNEMSLILLSFAGFASHLGLDLVKQTFEAAAVTVQEKDQTHERSVATAGPPSFSTVGDIGNGPFVVMAVDADPPPPFIAQIRHFLGPNFFSEVRTIGPADIRALVNTTPAIEEFIQPAPVPGTGAHRYNFLLFNQPEGFNSQTLVNSSTSIFNFSLSVFAAKTGLGDPIAGNFMLVAPDT
ncbi:hypothetical protein C0993_007944 [Termitomyces sp. T159_Od127]|nr:hypothetical protein C0993_007944 [Termitomyces sp. T159_Od127]